MHGHTCVCGHKWRHSDACKGNVKAHTCTECGAEVWERDILQSCFDSLLAFQRFIRALAA